MLRPLKLFWRGMGIAASILFLTACAKEDSSRVTDGREIYSDISLEAPASQNTVDYEETELKSLFVVRNIEEKDKTLLLREIHSGRELTLSYTGGTKFTDKYDSVIALSQIKLGEVVEPQYKEKESRLISMKISDKAWEYAEVSNLVIDRSKKNMSIGQDQYKYDQNLVLFSLNKAIDIIELNEHDVLTIKGYDRKICSIIVEKGHGYVRLENDDPFIGGWIELGQVIVKPITKDMLITAPEGDYKLTISSEGGNGFRSVTIKRDEETIVDIGGFKNEAAKSGSVDFTITPEEGVLFINGKRTKTEEVAVLEYGTYKVRVIAEGYKVFSESLTVDKPLINKEIKLEPEEETGTKTDKSSNNGTDSNNQNIGNSTDSSNNTSSTYKTYIDGPEGAKVYFNGIYMGDAPVNFPKTWGTHTVILSKEGYENKSYTILINDDEEDARFSFSELKEE